MSGWYAVKRGTIEHELFAPVGKWSKFEAWNWMIEAAAYKPTVIDIGGKPYTVPRGALCFSQRFLATKFKWSKKAITTFLETLESHNAITVGVIATGTGTRSKRTQVTLCNYEKYQSSGTKTEPKGDQKGTKEEQETNKNLPLEAAALSAPNSEAVEVSVLSKAVWNIGKPFLASRGVKNPGAIIGRWLKASQPPDILAAFDLAQRAGTQDPIPYITQILNGHSNEHSNHNSQRTNRRQDGFDPAAEQILRLTGLSQTSGDGGTGTGSYGEEDGPVRMGAGPWDAGTRQAHEGLDFSAPRLSVVGGSGRVS